MSPLVWKRELGNGAFRFYNLSVMRELVFYGADEIEEGSFGAFLIFLDGEKVELHPYEAIEIMNALYGRSVDASTDNQG